MAEINNIVWATDSSPEASEALKYAVALSKLYGSTIHSLYVSVLPETILPEHMGHLKDDFYKWVLMAQEKTKAKLEALRSELSKEGVELTVRIVQGKPSQKIIEYSRELEADLIVIGSRGLGLIDRLLVGSTALNTFKNSSTPVLAVKKRVPEAAPALVNILVPLDITEKIDRALNYAIDIALRTGGTITALFVFRLDTYSYEVPAKVLENLLTLSKNELKKRTDSVLFTRNITEPLPEIRTEVIHGISPAITISDYVNNNDFDIIIIDSHARSGLKKLILGSVTEKVIQQSNVPVLAINP